MLAIVILSGCDAPEQSVQILRCTWTNPFSGTEEVHFWEVDLANRTIRDLEFEYEYEIMFADDRLIKGGREFLVDREHHKTQPFKTVELDRRTLVLKTDLAMTGASPSTTKIFIRKLFCAAQLAAPQV